MCSVETACPCRAACVIWRAAEIRHELREFRALLEIKKNGDRVDAEIRRRSETFMVISQGDKSISGAGSGEESDECSD